MHIHHIAHMMPNGSPKLDACIDTRDLLVNAKFATALSAGAAEVKAPESKPWGQIVSYIRCPDGTLVELCSPIGG